MSEFTRPSFRGRIDAATVRATLRRHRWPRVVLLLAVSVAIGAQIDRALDSAAAAQDAWTPSEEVWVATADLAAGATLSTADTAPQPLPAIALPRDPVQDDPIGRRLRSDVAAGEILREGRMADAAVGDLAARLPPESGGLQLPVLAAHLVVGDRVDLYSLLTGERVATSAEVLAVNEGLATVAVTSTDLSAVIRSFTTGDVVPVVVG